MPALYRMPVVYLAVLIAALVVGAGSWAWSPRTDGSRVPAAAGEIAPTTPPAPDALPAPTPPAPPAPENDGILRTAEGLRRKVVVRELDLVCLSKPRGGRPVGSRLDYFSIHYLYGESHEKGAAMLQIGPREGPARGWVPASAVIEWDTRLMARPTRRAGRPALVIYRDKSCLLDALAHRVCPRHQGRCPTEGEERAKDRAGTAGAPMLGMPVLGSLSVPQPDGSRRTVFEVASLVRDQPPPAPRPTEPPPDLLPALRRVDVAFVIDTTASMQATIVSARELASRLVAEASKRYRDVNLRLALVEFRDASPAFGFKTRTVTPFTDAAGFRTALGRIEAARRGDGTVDEAVLDGVEHALRKLDWPTGRTGELATKLLVLLGDAPDHANDLTRARDLAAEANRSKITIAAVSLDRPGTLAKDEETRFRDQWRTLAEQSYRPLEKASGYTRPVPPALVATDGGAELVALLESLIHDRVERALSLAALAAAEAEGRLRDYVNSQGMTLEQVAPVLVDLHRGESAKAARPDPRFHDRRAPSIRLGWIAEKSQGKALVTLEVLIARPEIDVLIDELTRLQQAAQGTASDLADLLRIGNAAASGETGFLAADRGSQTFADHLRRRQGLPPARPDSLLRRTQSDLLQADELYRAALDAKLGTTVSELIRSRNERDWNDPRRTIEGMRPIPYALIDF